MTLICAQPGQLCWHIVDGADEDSVPLERHLVLVLVGIVQTEWLVNGGALVHEFNGAAWICRDVTDGNEPGGKMWGARGGLDPRDGGGAEKLLGVGDAQQARSLRRPVDPVHNHGTVGSVLVGKVADVAFRVLVELLLVISSTNLVMMMIMMMTMMTMMVISSTNLPLKLVRPSNLTGVQLVGVTMHSHLNEKSIQSLKSRTTINYLVKHTWSNVFMRKLLKNFLGSLGHISRAGWESQVMHRE